MSRSGYCRALNCLSAVSLLGVQLLSVDSLPVQTIEHDIPITVLGWDQSVSSGIKTEVCLIHELFIEGWVNGGVVTCRAGRRRFLSFEKFGKNKFLLIDHHIDIHTLALNRSTKVG